MKIFVDIFSSTTMAQMKPPSEYPEEKHIPTELCSWFGESRVRRRLLSALHQKPKRRTFPSAVIKVGAEINSKLVASGYEGNKAGALKLHGFGTTAHAEWKLKFGSYHYGNLMWSTPFDKWVRLWESTMGALHTLRLRIGNTCQVAPVSDNEKFTPRVDSDR